MARLDLDPRYDEVLESKAINFIKFITRLLHDAWQVTAFVNIQIVSASTSPVHVNSLYDPTTQ